MNSPYRDLFHRLTSNTHEPKNDRACWQWKRRTDRWGYARLEVYIPGLGCNKTLMAHIVAFVWVEAGCASPDEMYLAYIEFIASGLELDHTCENETCINVDHLDPCTPKENCQRRNARVSARLRCGPQGHAERQAA